MMKRVAFVGAIVLAVSGVAPNALLAQPSGTTPKVLLAVGGRAPGNIFDMTCPTPSLCVAVGTARNGSGTSTLFEVSNAGPWRRIASPNVAGATDNLYNGVACTSASSCLVVGVSSNNGSSFHSVTARWNGTTVSTVAHPVPAGTTTNLRSVACANPTTCFAVGWAGDSPSSVFVERWNGSAWAIVSAPNPASQFNELASIRCLSTTWCMAVGDQGTSAAVVPLAERWNGSTWAILPAPPGSGTAGGAFAAGVWCRTPTDCWAVGSELFPNGVDHPLADHWNGSGWVAHNPPDSPGALETDPYDVACPSTTLCELVGNWSVNGHDHALIERWNGSSWNVLPARVPAGAVNSYFNAVTCRSTTSCLAGGGIVTTTVLDSVVARLTPHGDSLWPGTSTAAATRTNGSLLHWYLTNTNTGTTASFDYGLSTDTPVVGDWDGTGTATVGVVRSVNGKLHWYLSNDDVHTAISVDYGSPGDTPLPGDYNGDGTTTIGVTRPAGSALHFFLSDDDATTTASFDYGLSTDSAVAGDWDGNGVTTVGVARANAGALHFYLSNDDASTAVSADYGMSTDSPVVGDWNGDGRTSIGVTRVSGSALHWYLTDNDAGTAQSFDFGLSTDSPHAGDWDGVS